VVNNPPPDVNVQPANNFVPPPPPSVDVASGSSDRSSTLFIVLGVVGGLAITGTIVLLVVRSNMG
jgi:hypothetical protein